MFKNKLFQKKPLAVSKIVYFSLNMIASLLFSSEVLAQTDTSLFVPIVLSSSGENGSFFTSELALTNRGKTNVTLDYRYTAAFGGGSGVASDSLSAGQQRIIPDAIAYLKSLGIPIPDSGDRGGTLSVQIHNLASPLDFAITVRTTTTEPEGRAGLAYPSVRLSEALYAPAYLLGLRQNPSDRSNVALQNMGSQDQGNIDLRVTVISGDASQPFQQTLPDITLSPGGWYQFSEILHSNGLSLDNGYVRIERVQGTAPYYAYGVINDQADSDGSFVQPVTQAALAIKNENLVLPEVIESGPYSNDVVFANLSVRPTEIFFEYEVDGTFQRTRGFMLDTGQQIIIPNLVHFLGIHQPFVGPVYLDLCADVDCLPTDGIWVGARAFSTSGGNRYGAFYNALPDPYGTASPSDVWLYDLRQDKDNRTNVALVNTGPDGASEFRIDIFDGSTGLKVNSIENITVEVGEWEQIGGILTQSGLHTTQGYAHITRTKGTNLFIAYAVINNGGMPGTGTGDGAFIASAKSVDSSSFSPTGSLKTPRSGHTATLLENGKVLIAGGTDASAELFDPLTETFSPTGSLSTSRFGATATLLASGKVLITGGYGLGDDQLPLLATAEIYDPATGTFSKTGSMTSARVMHTATLLNDGRVLITGGVQETAMASAELYNLASGTFTATGNMLSDRASHTATLLATGEVLIAGGWNGHAADAPEDPPYDPLFAELFQPSSRNFIQSDSMGTTRIGHAAVRLPNGKALLLGGLYKIQNRHEPPVNPTYAQLYDPEAHKFSSAWDFSLSQQGHTATLLANGMVLIAGGEQNSQAVDSVELFNPASGHMSSLAGLITGRRGHTATLLKSGEVLIIGGTDATGAALATAEIYR
jgi:hypothetical protein